MSLVTGEHGNGAGELDAGNGQARRILITGGAGFIGTNLAAACSRAGASVTILDSLAREGSRSNLEWLRASFGTRLRFIQADICDASALRQGLRDVDQVFHLAAQVAVTHSLAAPREDFRVNLEGTLSLLEEMRRLAEPPALVFTSTNKVYGPLSDLRLEDRESRWEPTDPAIALGVDESRPLDLYTPYGCSKGGAEQYVLDHSRSLGLRTAVLRMSCIYGPHQFGNEDQGWVAHFLLRALQGQPITIYGDGKQVRDLLHVDDLVRGMELAMRSIDSLNGRAFNIGGGPANAFSLLEVLDLIESIDGSRPEVKFAPGRVGDQLFYVSDSSAFRRATGWGPQIEAARGIPDLHAWLRAHRLAEVPSTAI